MAYKSNDKSAPELAGAPHNPDKTPVAETGAAMDALPRDHVAFALLYQQYRVPLYRYFYQQVGHVQDAEDLTALTFTKAFTSLHRYEERGNFAAWLFGIARHTLRDAQRRRRTEIDVDHVAPLLVDEVKQPEARVLEDEQTRVLNELLRQLPAEQQAALVLRFFGELSTNEVALKLGRSVGAVKMLVHRAITTLRGKYRQVEAAETAFEEGTTSPVTFVESLFEWACGGNPWRPVLQPAVCRVPTQRNLAIGRTTRVRYYR